MKVVVLTRGGLADTLLVMNFDSGNPRSNVWLSCQKSAEAILGSSATEGPNIKRFLKFEVLDGSAKTAENFI